MTTLSILVPAYNERPTLLSILTRVLAVDLGPIEREIVVVDDGSSDGTREIIAELDKDWRPLLQQACKRHGIDAKKALKKATIKGLLHPKNAGKAAAIRTALAASTGDLVLVQDADLEYDPGDYPRLIKPILDGVADVVYGSRFAGAERRALMFWHTLGNRAITTMVNAAADLNLSDVETCYKVFRGDLVRELKLDSERFGFEVEVTIKLSRMRYRVYEVPISYHGRGYDLGKKIGWKDAVEAAWCTVKYSLDNDVLKGAIQEEALRKLKGAEPLNKAIGARLKPWLGKCVVEVGSGHGNITNHLVGPRHVVATDLTEATIDHLQDAFRGYDNVDVVRWDMTEPLGWERPSEAPPVDTIVAINVVEHIEDDDAALQRAREILEPTRGHLVVLVPAHQALMGPFDRAIGHHRRYDKRSLRALFERNGFEVEHEEWFNLLGLPGWWYNARVRQSDRISGKQLSLYNAVSRAWLPIEADLPLPVGLSLIMVGRPV